MMDSSTMTEAVDDYGKLATLVHGLKDEMTAMRAAQSQMMIVPTEDVGKRFC